MKSEIDAAVSDVFATTQFILGPQGEMLEKEMAAYLDVKHAIGVASGTDALHLALRAAGLGEGDEIITTPFTFIATAEAIAYVRSSPVFVDVDPRTFNLDVQKVKNAIIELLPDGRLSDNKVAEALFMSPRNLQRKLEAEGTTFKTLLTEIRRDLALKYIQDTELTLTEISFMLGFSEMSAFSRAFKQWTGKSPRVQRQQLNPH